MHSFLDAKVMAKSLREALATNNIALSHSACLELVAKQFGVANWNILAARIDAATSTKRDLTLPHGWFVTNPTNLKHYRLGVDPAAPGTALIESRFGHDSGVDLSESYAVLTQSIVADAYRGGKVELTASLKTEEADLGTIWLRVDRAPGSALRFDNMMSRKTDGALRGAAGWAVRKIVLEVPDEATSPHFGFFLQGYGRVRARDFRLEAVSATSRTQQISTSLPARRVLIVEPRSLAGASLPRREHVFTHPERGSPTR